MEFVYRCPIYTLLTIADEKSGMQRHEIVLKTHEIVLKTLKGEILQNETSICLCYVSNYVIQR